MFKSIKQTLKNTFSSQTSTSIPELTFKRFHSIYQQMIAQEKNTLTFQIKGLMEPVEVIRYSIPYSIDADELKKAGFSNGLEFLNSLYLKMNITPLDEETLNDAITNELEFDYLHFRFHSLPPSTEKLKSLPHNFLVFFCCTHNQEINATSILFSQKLFFNYVNTALSSKVIDLMYPENEVEKNSFALLEKVLQGSLEFLKSNEIEQLFPSTFKDNVCFDISEKHYYELIEIINPNIKEKKKIKMAEKLFTHLVTKNKKDEGDLVKWIASDYWMSDWKFEAEDVNYFLSSLTGEIIEIDFPEEIYSADLFPFIQLALKQKNLHLMNYNSWGDSYYFIVVDNSKAKSIQETASLLGIDLHTV